MDEHRAQWPLAVIARVLDVSRQGYHAWKRRMPSQRTIRRQALVERMHAIDVKSDGSYGSPRMTRELRKDGTRVKSKTVEHLMRKAGIRGTQKRRYCPTTDSSKTLAPAPNLLQRAFDVRQINRVWLSDFTELPCRNGKAYAVAIMDLC